MACGVSSFGHVSRLTACFCPPFFQAVVSSELISIREKSVASILKDYNEKLERGTADVLATLKSVASAIGPASELHLSRRKQFLEIFSCELSSFPVLHSRGTGFAWRWQFL
jgi:hypothetical protein